MPFKDSKEGSTHYQNDGCGEPAHNDKVACCKECSESKFALKGKMKEKFKGICGLVCECHVHGQQGGYATAKLEYRSVSDIQEQKWKETVMEAANPEIHRPRLEPMSKTGALELIKFIEEIIAAQHASLVEKVKKKKGNSTRHDAAYEERYEGIDEFCRGFDEAIDSTLSLLTPTQEKKYDCPTCGKNSSSPDGHYDCLPLPENEV